MTVSFKCDDGQHYLCAEEDGRVVADRTAVGPWEQWALESVGTGWALKSAHGRYLCAELDGSVVANREAVGPWETWLVEVSAGRVSFKSAHGKYLVAEGGGGSVVRANRDAIGPWEQFTPSAEWWDQHPPVTLTRLHVEANKRYFANDAGRFDWREITAFSLLSRLLTGEVDYVRQWLHRRRAEGFTVTRVICTLDGGYWHDHCPAGRSFRCAPDMPGYWTAFDLLVQLHAEAGLYLPACFLGALEPFGGIWYPDRRDVYTGPVRTKAEQFVLECVTRLVNVPHVIGELANEPTQIGLRDSWPALVTLGGRAKKVAPQLLLCGGEDNEQRNLCDPFDWADAHFDRAHEVHGWQWVKRMGEHWTVDQPQEFPKGHPREFQPTGFKQMPFVAGENRNMGEPRVDGNTDDGPETQPAVCFGVAAVSRARRMGGICFHWDGGLWTTEPKPETQACLQAWHKGFDAFPMRTDSMWRGHWEPAQGNYWKRDIWPASDDPGEVERHLGGAKQPWRAFGCGPDSVVFPLPKGWDWKRNTTAAAHWTALETQGFYECGIFRKD